MNAWRQRAGPAEPRQGREPAEPVARSASLDGASLVRQRPPMRSWPDIRPEHTPQTARLRQMALGILIPNGFFVEAALRGFAPCRYSANQNNVQADTYDPRRPAATPSLLSCRQSVAVRVQPIVMTSTRLQVVMSAIVDSGREGGRGNIHANDPQRMSNRQRQMDGMAQPGHRRIAK